MPLPRREPDGAAARERSARPGKGLLLLLAGAAVAAIGVLAWASIVAGSTATGPEPVEIPSLSEETVPATPQPAGAGASLEALLPGIPPTLRLVVPAAGGAAELWEWPTSAAAPVVNPDIQAATGQVSLHGGGLWAAEIDFRRSLSLGTVFKRVFHSPGVHSLAWHGGGKDRLAWISQSGADRAELWTASISSFSIDSRRVAEMPQITLGSAEVGDGGFLVAFGDWGYVIERALPTSRTGDVAFPISQIMVVDPDGAAGPWRDGRLLAAAPDGRLLVGTINVLSGTYRLELTGPDLAPGDVLPWVSIGHTSWSPDGRHLFNMVGFGPPTIRFSITSDGAEQRFRFDARFANPLGWSADGRYFLLGAILPEGRQLVIVDADTGALVMAPIDRLPRYAGLG